MGLSLLTQWKIVLAGLATAIATTSPIPLFSSQSNNPTQNIPTSSNISRNWSGYAATNGTFTSVTGTWIVPTVTARGHTASDAAWIGIGGVQNEDLIQAGTQNIVDENGQIEVSPFYEMLPDASQSMPVSVNPGDSVTFTIIQQSPGQWQIGFTDNTNGNTYDTTVSYNSSESSAEWIEEAPSDGEDILPLDNFDTISFTNGSTTQNGNHVTIEQSGAQPIVLANRRGQTLATPSALGNDGASFTITRTNDASSAPNPQFDSNPGGWRRREVGITSGGGNTPTTNLHRIIERRGLHRQYRKFTY